MVTGDGGGCKRKRKMQIDAAQQEDILFKILTKLRPKSLFRFKLACKSWMALISDPFFINSYSHRSNEIVTMKPVGQNSVVLMDGKGRHKSALIPLFSIEDSMKDPNLSFCPTPIVHYGGLFLISIGYHAERLMVCKPATREVVVVPLSKYIPNISGVGLGLDPSTNTYKVVRVFFQQDENGNVFFQHDENGNTFPTCAIEVITLGAVGNSWRHKAHPPDIFFEEFVAVTVQGASYWPIININYYLDQKMSILRFDLSNEEFTVIDPPDPYKLVYLVELQGHLCCYGTIPLISVTPTVWVWLSNDNLVGWTLRYTIHFQDRLFLDGRLHFMPIAIDQEGCLLFKFKQHMHRYNPRTNQFYGMDDAYAPEIMDTIQCCHTTSYVQTIMPISSDR